MTTLPADAPWLNRPALAVLVGALGAGQARYVGGAVRDTLLGIAVKDVDIATPLEPQEVMRRLKAHAIQVIPPGIDHGTVTAIIEGGPVEITTLRKVGADANAEEVRGDLAHGGITGFVDARSEDFVGMERFMDEHWGVP